MLEKYFKYLVGFFFLLSFLMILTSLFESKNQYNVSITPIQRKVEGLDLKAVGELVKKAKNAEDFERLLNDKSVGINNLDLNGDGKIDYIKVTEFGSGDVRGFSLSVDLKKGEEQEIATIKIARKSENDHQIEMAGSPHVYGPGHYYHSSFGSFAGGMMLGYLWSSHRSYASPWGYGSYPSYYRSSPTVSRHQYQTHSRNFTKNSSAYTRTSQARYASVRSPNSHKVSSAFKSPIRKPTRSQRSFSTRRSSTRKSFGGGFGRSSRRSFSARRSGFGRSFSRGK